MLPELRAHYLGKEIRTLTRDAGARLAEIISELRLEAERDPGNLLNMIALQQALVNAGLVQEAHPLAQANYERMRRLPAVGSDVLQNVGLGLAEAGKVVEAKHCLERAFARDPSDNTIYNLICVAGRFGELDWLDRLAPNQAMVNFLKHYNLAEIWPRQQAAVEAVLQPHVSTFGAVLSDFRDGTYRLLLDYFTDTMDPARIGEYEEAVWATIERVYQEHPDGPGAILGIAVLNIHGINIPLPTP